MSVDPIVVDWVRKASASTGADPVALLADALQESGARRGAVGDNGTSFGPWQFHIGGALGSHAPAWANTYAAALNRAQAFARANVHGGTGAAAVQRPADRAAYARGVDSLLSKARTLLGELPPVPAGATPSTKTSNPILDAASYEGPSDAQKQILLSGLLSGDSPSYLLSLMQQGGGSGAPTPQVSQPSPLAGSGAPNSTLTGKVTTLTPKIIGEPHQGTHTLGNWQSDNAIDISMPVGTPIYAPADGVIGNRIGSLGSSNPRFAGLRVTLNGAGQSWYMAHLSRLAVKAGQKVKKGQIIGYSGEANGVAHLHLGVLNGNPTVYA